MKSRTVGTYLISALAVVGVVALVVSRSVTAEATYPVERARRTFVQKAWSRVYGFFHGAAASAENVRLRREVESLALLRGDVERLETENARLRRALEYKARQPGRWLAAGVLSEGGAAGVSNFLRVDKGSLAGVREGAIVTVPEGLVGRVASVTPHTAEVLLVTDRSLKVACEVDVGGPVPLRGILSGGDDDLLVLRHLTGAERVPPRSKVYTSGLGGIFPKGIEVGALLVVRKDAKGLACEGEVQPPVVYSTLEDVFIRCEK